MTNPAPINRQRRNLALHAANHVKFLRRLCATVTSLLLCLGFFGAAHSAGLTLEQQSNVASLAANVPWPSSRNTVTGHPLGSQTLSIEKQERKNARGIRFANVYQYNYTQRTARLLVMDIQQGTTVKQTSIDSVHLPLNQDEINYAISLLAGNDELMDALRREHSLRSPQPFTTMDELDIKASIHEPRQADHICQFDRCALLSLFDKSSTVFTLEPVVNLSRLSVSDLDSQ